MTVVDFHAHHFPKGLPDMALRTGDSRWPSLQVADSGDKGRLMRGESLFRPIKAACFDQAQRIGDLDAAGVDLQVISPVPITLVDWAKPSDAHTFLAAQNDGLAEAARTSAGRLVALGAVPLQDADLAVAEMMRCRNELGMVGIEITAMVAGKELDNEALDPFWNAAESEQVPIFIHPAHQDSAIRRSGQPVEFGLGMLTDTALAATALVYGGVLEKYPNLRIALSHGCGTFGWAHPRLRYFASRQADVGSALDEMVRSLWVDTLLFDPGLFGVLVERFGSDHIMFGTDHPFLPEGIAGQREILDLARHQHPDLGEGCLGSNALEFLGLVDAL